MSDRAGIQSYIWPASAQAARSIDRRIVERAQQLRRFPRLGRPGRIEGTRELVVPPTPYVIAYRIDGQTVRILRVIHGMMRWPGSMPD